MTGSMEPPRTTVCVKLPVITSFALLDEATEELLAMLEEDLAELELTATLEELASLRPRHFTLSTCKVPLVPEVP